MTTTVPTTSDAQPVSHSTPILTVVPWADAETARCGYDPRSAYVERFWLGVLGPSAVWLLRRFARGFDDHPQGFRVNLADTGRALGLGEGTGRSSTVIRTIERCCQFGAAQLLGASKLAVRTHLPPLSPRQVARLPESVQAAHERWRDPEVDPAELRRAVAATLSMLRRGEDPWTVEANLTAWGFGESLASHAVRQALTIIGDGPPPAA